MSSPQRSKQRGYEVEIAALRALRPIFLRLRRRGSVAFSKSAADLEQEGIGNLGTVFIVATMDKRQPVLVTMSAAHFELLAHRPAAANVRVVVQVKGLARSRIGTLWRELREATTK